MGGHSANLNAGSHGRSIHLTVHRGTGPRVKNLALVFTGRETLETSYRKVVFLVVFFGSSNVGNCVLVCRLFVALRVCVIVCLFVCCLYCFFVILFVCVFVCILFVPFAQFGCSSNRYK